MALNECCTGQRTRQDLLTILLNGSQQLVGEGGCCVEGFHFEGQFPELASEVQAGLSEIGELELATQVSALRVVERCRCGDDFCAMMYTQPPPSGAWGPGLRNVDVPVANGMVILDVVYERIASIEVLFRSEVRSRLLQLIP